MPPRKTPVERNLPLVKNDLMLGEVDPTILSTKCRVQDVRFGPSDEEGVTETFVRIKTQIPQSEMPHFIMRKAADDYISATSMFRAVYYKCNESQEQNEMKVVKRELAARSDENASGVWIPGTPDALQLADVYGIRPWVQALLDAPTSKAAYPQDQRSPAANSPTRPSPPTSSSVAATPSRKATRERSQSPRKSVAASTRKVKKVAKDAVDTIKEDANEIADTVQKTVTSASKKIETKLSPKAPKNTKANSTKPSEQVAMLTTDDSDEVQFSPNKDAEGSSISDMIAEARQQVEVAKEKDAQALSKSGLSSTAKSASKKRELEVDADDEVKNQIISVKRGRVEELEVGLIQEKRKVRALYGLVLGLGATAILPYLL